MIRIACCNLKGGVGKTTCAVSLGVGLARLGARVLAVDFDPQAHLTDSLGLAAPSGGGVGGVLRGQDVATALLDAGALTVLPASPALADAETALAGLAEPWTRLGSQLRALEGYDVALFDCPPHLGPLTRCAVAAAERLLVPMTPDFLALQSLARFVASLQALGGPDPSPAGLLGIVLNRYAARKTLHREVLDAVQAHFPGVCFATKIRENIALAEAPSHGQDIFTYAPHSAGAQDFAALSRELAERLGLAANALRGASSNDTGMLPKEM